MGIVIKALACYDVVKIKIDKVFNKKFLQGVGLPFPYVCN